MALYDNLTDRPVSTGMIFLLLMTLPAVALCQGSEPPVANFTFTPSQPSAGSAVTFDASSSFDLDGSIIHYEWDFDNDGVIDSSGMQVSWKFEKAGQYEVRLIVIDDRGLSSSATQIIAVTGASSPANFTPFVSGGMAPLGPLVIIKGAVGIPFRGNLLGQISLGYGSGETAKGGSPVTVNATAVDLDILCKLTQSLYVGGGAGLLMLQGEYHIEWPVVGSKQFSRIVFTMNLLFSIKFGPFMLEGGLYGA